MAPGRANTIAWIATKNELRHIGGILHLLHGLPFNRKKENTQNTCNVDRNGIQKKQKAIKSQDLDRGGFLS